MKDQTLNDYIKRTMENLEKENKTPQENKNEQDQYLVYPEDDGYDRPRNPYSTV